MRLTKREARQLPTHELLDRLEGAWVDWRFSSPHSALEGAASAALGMLTAELDRRRRRSLVTGCTCAICWEAVMGSELQE